MPQSQVMNAPLLALNEALPPSVQVAGRLRQINNAIAQKWQASELGSALKVIKRDGFAPLPTSVFDPTTGLASGKTLANMSMLGTLGKRLVAICAAAPFVLSESAACWESPPVLTPNPVLHERTIVDAGGLQYTPDSARIGTRTMYVWSQQRTLQGGTYATIVDDDGTVIRSTFLVDAPNLPGNLPKIVADGTRFWVADTFNQAGPVLGVNVFDANGHLLGGFTTTGDASTYYDIQWDSTNGVVVIQKTPTLNTIDTIALSWSGVAVISSINTLGGTLASTGKVAFLRNDTGDGKLYLVGIDGTSPTIGYRAWQSSTTATSHTYTIATGQSLSPAEIIGFVKATGNKDITVALSFLDATVNAQLQYANGTPQLNFTDIYTVTFAGVSTKQNTRRGLTSVSRVMLLGGLYHAVMYYHSQPSTVTNTNQVQQSTFFLVNIDFGSTYQTVGQFESTIAYADWQDVAVNTNYIHVTSPNVDPSGGVHVALTYRATTFTTTVFVGPGDTKFQASLPANTTGIKDFQFGPDNALAFEFSNELFMGGSRTNNFDGANFVEDGMPLMPEILTITSTAGGSKTTGGTYQYVAVAEYTDNNGNLVFSAASTPFTFVNGGGGNLTNTVTGTMLHTTSKLNVRISLYCTFIALGIQSTQHYKVTDDLNPVINNDGNFTWSFGDGLSDAATAARTILYTDKGLLDHFPCPPQHAGCFANNRAFVIGYDNAVWFSAPKVEGEKVWFTPYFRIPLPTNERMVQVQPLGNYLVVLGERATLYAIPILSLPDATGAGTIPDAQLLTSITHGCTGAAISTSSGIWFASTQGGIWQIKQNLNDTFSGAPVIDETTGHQVLDFAADANQRIAAITSNKVLVYDQVTSCWYTWDINAGSINFGFIASHKGQFAVNDSGNARVLRQTAGTVSDITSIPIQTAITIYLHFAGVRGFMRIWDLIATGEWRGDHDLGINAFFDDDFSTIKFTYGPFTPAAAPTPYVFDLPPKIEECSSLSLTFFDNFPRGNSAGFALEMLTCEFGVEPGLARLIPSTQRVSSS